MSSKKVTITEEDLQKDFKFLWCRRNFILEHLPTNKRYCIDTSNLNIQETTNKIVSRILMIYDLEIDTVNNTGLKGWILLHLGAGLVVSAIAIVNAVVNR